MACRCSSAEISRIADEDSSARQLCSQGLRNEIDDMNNPAEQLNIETKSENCFVHGDFVSRRIFGRVWSRCPICQAERDASEAMEKAARERKEKLERWQAKVGEAGIPERFQNRSLQSFIATTEKQKAALAFCVDYADTFDQVLKTGRCAVFLGLPGTGKTHLAIGIGLRIMHRDNRSVLFSTVMRAIRRVKDTWSRASDESETAAIGSLVFPDLLILDEVGIQFGSETEKLILFDVLNERYEKHKPTLLLSNLSLPEVKAFLGERIFDRMREDGGEVIPFDWSSYRGQAAA